MPTFLGDTIVRQGTSKTAALKMASYRKAQINVTYFGVAPGRVCGIHMCENSWEYAIFRS